MRALMVLILVALITGGCAADGIAPGVAGDLAGQAERIAVRLESGDTCEAASLATQLRADVDAAIARGDVPTTLVGDLDRQVTALEAVGCVPPTPTPTPSPTETRRKGKDKGHDEGKDD